MNILHLSEFTPSQLSALHVPEEKQIKDSFTACFNVETNDGFAASTNILQELSNLILYLCNRRTVVFIISLKLGRGYSSA